MNTRSDSYDEHVVDALLSETGEHGQEDLRAALLDLRSFAHTSPPALPLPARARRLASAAGRRRAAGRRAVVTSLVVAATLGLGAGAAAAASPTFRESARQAVAGLVGQAPVPAPSVADRTPAPAPERSAPETAAPAAPAAPATAAPIATELATAPGRSGSHPDNQAKQGRDYGHSTALTHRVTPTLPPEAPLSGPPVRLPAGAGEVTLPGHGDGAAKVRVPAPGDDEEPGRSGSANSGGSKPGNGTGRADNR